MVRENRVNAIKSLPIEAIFRFMVRVNAIKRLPIEVIFRLMGRRKSEECNQASSHRRYIPAYGKKNFSYIRECRLKSHSMVRPAHFGKDEKLFFPAYWGIMFEKGRIKCEATDRQHPRHSISAQAP